MIEFEKVTYTYPSGVTALRDISLSIGGGEIVALMGENGAGKTTFLKLLNGLLKPTSGVVRVDGVDTRTTTVASLARLVGLVFQNPDSMFFCPTVLEEVSYALIQFGLSKEEGAKQAEKTLISLGLWHLRNLSPFTLSGGEKKRLAIAVVMAWSPKYVVIDEPTSGLDGRGKRTLKELLEELLRGGKCVIISSHDVEFVSEVASRVVLLRRGEVIADGPSEEILTNTELLTSASLLTPQIPALFKELRDQGFRGLNHRCIKMEDALRELSSLLGRPNLDLRSGSA
ncbi:MAG: energy-coupling factor ABC transporter ATP-binding protein [Nitrososphaerota archaeon]